MGVSRTSGPASPSAHSADWRITRLAARSTTTSPMRTRGTSLSPGTRRLTARIRASSSSMLNGLVT